MTRKSFTVPFALLDRPQYSRLNALAKALMLGLYAECDDYGILPVLKAGRRSEMDLLGYDAVTEIVKKLSSSGLVHIYMHDGEEYMRLDDYDSHLSSQQLGRRSPRWPHEVNIELTPSAPELATSVLTPRTSRSSRANVRPKVTPISPGVNMKKSNDPGNLPRRTVRKVLRPVTSRQPKTDKGEEVSDIPNDSKTLPLDAPGINCKPRAKSRRPWNDDTVFGEFWNAYRTTAKTFGASAGSKKEAYEAWRARKCGGQMSDIMQGLVLWAQSQDWADGRIRHACRWLKAEMWTDEPAPAAGNKPHYQPTAEAPVLSDDAEAPF